MGIVFPVTLHTAYKLLGMLQYIDSIHMHMYKIFQRRARTRCAFKTFMGEVFYFYFFRWNMLFSDVIRKTLVGNKQYKILFYSLK